MLRGVGALRGVHARGDALTDLGQRGHQLRDVAILRVIRGTSQVPDGRIGRRRSWNATSGRQKFLGRAFLYRWQNHCCSCWQTPTPCSARAIKQHAHLLPPQAFAAPLDLDRLQQCTTELLCLVHYKGQHHHCGKHPRRILRAMPILGLNGCSESLRLPQLLQHLPCFLSPWKVPA